jgi:hypothetical protein
MVAGKGAILSEATGTVTYLRSKITKWAKVVKSTGQRLNK